MVTTFLMDKGRLSNGLSFPYKNNEHYFYDNTLPEVAVGYELEFLRKESAKNGLKLYKTLWGSWRHSDDIICFSGFPQDILLFVKE